MSDLIKLETLEEIESKYNIFFIDLWGVIHNGLELFENVKIILKDLRKKKLFFSLRMLQEDLTL